MELCLDVPRKKYTKTGKKAIYIPTIGGTLPKIAYAIPMRIISTIKHEIYGSNNLDNRENRYHRFVY